MQHCYSTPAFEQTYTYSGNDLGAVWAPDETAFRLWAPTAEAVTLLLYSAGEGFDPFQAIPMLPDVQGTWRLRLRGNWDGTYYTYRCLVEGQWREACDPYARAVGVNGQRAMVLNLAATDPADWEHDCNPHAGAPITDAVICELHVRDLSADRSVRFQNRGTFLALTETGRTTKGGMAAGIDHFRALGVTHIQLLPVFDFCSVDEKRPGYNWGYDPANYNAPEGSYSTNPYDGVVRIRELKQAIQALHRQGLGVVMDVVFNHVYDREGFCFNQIVPGFFSRILPGGTYSNGSGCGNDTASERPMVRKYILDSLRYWAEEYHMDGFRFDLAGLLDVETLRQAIQTLRAIRPDLLLYGEGWDMPTHSTKPNVPMAIQANAALLPGFAFFNDTLRDFIRGSVFEATQPGFAGGRLSSEAQRNALFMGMPFWAAQPDQCINYVSCHDNHTLFDRLALAAPQASRELLIRMNNLAAAFTILSQGVPFFQAGEELLRTKPGRTAGTFLANTYRSGPGVNAIRWSDLDKPEYAQVSDYYRGLIAFRKAHPALRLTRREDIARRVFPVSVSTREPAVFYVDDTSTELLVVFHPGQASFSLPLPEGVWEIHIHGNQAGTQALGTVSGSYTVAPVSAAVLVRRKPVEVVAALIWEQDRFLICQRPAGKSRGLLWEFVGGKVEPGESPEAALVRECQEELGVTVEVQNLFTQVVHEYPDIFIRLSLYHCIIAQGQPQRLEHNDLQWIHAQELDRYPFCPADEEILSKITEVYGGLAPL